MAKKKVAMELGMGTSLRRQDYTKAAIRALQDALWHNSLTMADAFGFSREDMIVEVEIGVQKPEKVDIEVVKAILPYGKGSVQVVHGGLDIAKPASKNSSNPDGANPDRADTDNTVIANAAVNVFFDMQPAAGKGAGT